MEENQRRRGIELLMGSEKHKKFILRWILDIIDCRSAKGHAKSRHREMSHSKYKLTEIKGK